MKKVAIFSLTLVISLAMLSLTGCGGQDVPASYGPGGEDYGKEYHGESEVQGGIKSDEEIASITEEAENNTTTEEPSYEDNTGHEPDGYSTGNFQDYWQGDDYFDIVAYLKANGAENVYATNTYSYPVEDEDNINLYVASFYGQQWEITIMSETGITIGHAYWDDDGRLCKNPHYIASCPPENLGNMVTVDKNGTTVYSGVLNLMDTAVQYMKINRDSDDPLTGSGINYISQPL